MRVDRTVIEGSVLGNVWMGEGLKRERLIVSQVQLQDVKLLHFHRIDDLFEARDIDEMPSCVNQNPTIRKPRRIVNGYLWDSLRAAHKLRERLQASQRTEDRGRAQRGRGGANGQVVALVNALGQRGIG